MYLQKGICEKIGIDGRLTHSQPEKDKVVVEAAMPMYYCSENGIGCTR